MYAGPNVRKDQDRLLYNVNWMEDHWKISRRKILQTIVILSSSGVDTRIQGALFPATMQEPWFYREDVIKIRTWLIEHLDLGNDAVIPD